MNLNRIIVVSRICSLGVIISMLIGSSARAEDSDVGLLGVTSCVPYLVGNNLQERLQKLNHLHEQPSVAEYRLSTKHVLTHKHHFLPLPSIFVEHRMKVIDVSSLDRTSRANQLVMRVPDLVRMFPELVTRIVDLIKKTDQTTHEHLFAVYVMRDIPTQKMRMFVGDLATSGSSYKVDGGATDEQTNIDGREILKHLDYKKTEMLELWMIHTHPQTYQPLSSPDLEFTDRTLNEAMEETGERPPLTLRMMAIAGDFKRTKDLILFSSTYISSKRPHSPVLMTDTWTHEELGLEK